MPNWLSRILVVAVTAALLFALIEGGYFYATHPLPEGTLMPLAMVAGLVGLVYGARKGR